MKYLIDKGIEVSTHYRPINTVHHMAKYVSEVPVAERIGSEIIKIPIHTNLSDEDVTYVVRSINAFRQIFVILEIKEKGEVLIL